MPPKTLIDKNIASDYVKLGKLFELKNINANTEVLEDIIKWNPVYCELTEQFSLEKTTCILEEFMNILLM